jgi:uncharacterized protein (DUF2141 family)
MNHRPIKKHCFFIYVLLLSLLSSFMQDKKALKITFTKLEDTQSIIRIGVYRKQDDFPQGTIPFKGYEVSPEGKKSVSFSITDLEYGEYAIAVYQDENGDKKLNTKMFGIPKEPYAFSKNFKPTFSAPKYDDCKFTYSSEKNELTIAILD